MTGASAAVTAVLTTLFLSWVLRQARRPIPTQPDGTFVLAYGRWMLALGVVCGILAPAGIVVIAVMVGFREPNDPYYVAGLLAFFVLMGGWCLAEALKRRVVVSDRGLVEHSPWRRTRRVDWSDVVAVKFGNLSGYVTLVGRSGQQVKVSIMLRGIAQLADAVGRHVPPALAAAALTGLAARLERSTRL